jgi:small subunit ribosomal protein S34
MLSASLASGSLRKALSDGRQLRLPRWAAARAPAPPQLLACRSRWCSGAAAPEVPPKEPKRNLFEVASELPNYGMGAKLYRSSWAAKGYEPSDYHWTVTKVVLKDKGVDKQLKRGDAWGVLRWKGVLEDKVRRIRTPLKKEWCHLFEPYSQLVRRGDARKALRHEQEGTTS